MTARYVPLHLHSEYSLVDSTIRIPELVAACAARGLPAVAITDQNNLFALVKFYKEAEKAGIKPIAGADVLVAEGTAAPTRLTLLCRDNDGYLSLSQILTRAWMEGHRVDGVVARPAWLAENAGLFAIAGPQSEPGQLFASGRHDLAEQALADLQSKFGERLHLELLRTGRNGEDAFNAFALDLSARRGIPVVASNDVRFLDADGFDAAALEAMLCKRPMVIGHRISGLTYAIVKAFGLLKSAHVSLPNVLAGETMVPELLQDACTASNLNAALLNWFRGADAVAALQPKFLAIHQSLRRDASARAADAVADLLATPE